MSNLRRPCGILYAILAVFAIHPSTGLAGDDADGESRPAMILDAGEGTPIAFPLHPTSRLAAASSNEAGMSFFEIVIHAGRYRRSRPAMPPGAAYPSRRKLALPVLSQRLALSSPIPISISWGAIL